MEFGKAFDYINNNLCSTLLSNDIFTNNSEDQRSLSWRLLIKAPLPVLTV